MSVPYPRVTIKGILTKTRKFLLFIMKGVEEGRGGENQRDNKMGYVQDPELKVGEKKMCCIQDPEQDGENKMYCIQDNEQDGKNKMCCIQNPEQDGDKKYMFYTGQRAGRRE